MRARRCSAWAVSSASWRAIASMPMRCIARTAAASATAPTTFGVPASSRSGPCGPGHLVERHELDRAAAALLGLAALERVAPADQRAGAERRVHLVRRQRHVVEVRGIVERADVDRAGAAPVARSRPGSARRRHAPSAAMRCTSGMWPVTFEPPRHRHQPRRARRAARADASRCASSSRPSASTPMCSTRARARQGRSLL